MPSKPYLLVITLLATLGPHTSYLHAALSSTSTSHDQGLLHSCDQKFHNLKTARCSEINDPDSLEGLFLPDIEDQEHATLTIEDLYYVPTSASLVSTPTDEERFELKPFVYELLCIPEGLCLKYEIGCNFETSLHP